MQTTVGELLAIESRDPDESGELADGLPYYTHPMTCRHTGQARGACACPHCREVCRRILAVLSDTEREILHSLSSCAGFASDAPVTGQVPGFPQPLADSLESAVVERFVCGGKGVG